MASPSLVRQPPQISSASTYCAPTIFSACSPTSRSVPSPYRDRRHLPHRPFYCKASWQEVAGVVVFSAIPFTAVKAIANSSLGETLRSRMEEKKKAAIQQSSKFRDLTEKARRDSIWYGEDRPRWLGTIPYDYPAHLAGDLPGDYGQC